MSTIEQHSDVRRQLDEHEQRLTEYAKRLRRLEIEAGIYKPPLRGVVRNSSRT